MEQEGNMSVYIRGMEMPKYATTIIIRRDGRVIGPREDYIAIPVPDHGRLLDEDKICEMLQAQREDEYNKTHKPNVTWSRVVEAFEDLLGIVDTAIPADKEAGE